MPSNSPTHDTDQQPGVLYVVATPIGNMADITLRALQVLADVDVIACEDTRHTGKLIAHHGLPKRRLVALHEYNEKEKALVLARQLQSGRSVALVSDAGTPAVSDPGYALVHAALAAGITVTPIPGPSALVTALSAAGLPTHEFVFIGFPAKKKGPRTKQLLDTAGERRTLVFYQSPRRMLAFIEELMGIFGDRQAVLARELTKLHEEFIRGRLSQIRSRLEAKKMVKGECTLLVSGLKQPDPVPLADLRAQIVRLLNAGGERPSDLAKKLARQHSLPKKQVYQLVLECQASASKQG